MKKRVLSLLLTGAVLVSLLSGCGTVKEKEENSGASQPAQADQSSQNTSSEEGNTDKPAEGKTLVVYFSATGTTEKVAGMIAEATGGDLFELEPVNPYTDEDLNWRDSNGGVAADQQHQDHCHAGGQD